ncbi:MAG TPA: MMPL family transporter, partial [Trebonia sp.]
MTTSLTSKDSRQHARAPVVERVAGWSARHRIVVVVGWLLLVAAAFTVGQRLGVTNTNAYDPGQAGQAERVLNEPGVQQPDHESVLIRARSLAQTFGNDLELRQATQAVVSTLSRLPHAAADIRSPFTTTGLTSGNSALVTFSVAGNPNNDDQAVVPALNAVAAVQARYPGLVVAEAGDASLDRATGALVDKDFRQAEITSVPVSLALLLLVFGALVAAGIPLLLAGTSVISAISLLAIPSRLVPISSTTSSIVLLVGMAVGIDYSLFYLRRVREERAAGATTQDALRTAARTSGRAIVAAGLTVIACMAGLFVTGFEVFDGVAIGTMLVVAVAVLGSLTFLPALISLLGKATDRARVPFLGRRQATARPSRAWRAVVTAVTRRPLALGGLAAVALLALATPLATLHLEDPGINSFPDNVPVVRTLDQILTAFPGGPVPAEVVVTGDNLTGPQVTSALTALNHAAAASHGVIREPITTAAFDGGHVLVVSVPIAGHVADAASNSALITLRDHVLPATLGKVPGISYAVGGNTASSFDVNHQLGVTAPLLFALVAVVAFVLLMITFRSRAIAALSILLNLLSVAAAFGLMTLVFQHGLLHGPLGFTPYGGIVPWMPVFMFVLLFGLSMDYQVFILSRITELRR